MSGGRNHKLVHITGNIYGCDSAVKMVMWLSTLLEAEVVHMLWACAHIPARPTSFHQVTPYNCSRRQVISTKIAAFIKEKDLHCHFHVACFEKLDQWLIDLNGVGAIPYAVSNEDF